MKKTLIISTILLAVIGLVGWVRYNNLKNAVTKENVFNGVNEWRQSQSFLPLKYSNELCSIAQTRLNEVKTDWSHDKFIVSRFCKDCTLGENLSKGSDSSQLTLLRWINSESHRKVMSMPFTHSCVATDGNYVVQIFGYR